MGVPAGGAKVAETAPTGTVIEEGTLSRTLLSANATIVPPVGAVWFSVTVHVVEAPERTVVGLQVRSVRLSGSEVVIVPPVAAMGTALPDCVAPNALVTLIEATVVPGEIVAFTTATTPLWIMFALSSPVLSPVKKQV